MPSKKSTQTVIAAMDKFFAYRTVQDAKLTVEESSKHRVTATIEVDGTVERKSGQYSSASPGPIYEALVIELAARVDDATLRRCRKAAVKHAVKAAAEKTRPATMLSERDRDAKALIASLKQDAAEKLPQTYRAGSFGFHGEATVTQASVRKA